MGDIINREGWQRIRVLQIFVEHVMMKHDGMVQFANRLDWVCYVHTSYNDMCN